MEVPRSPVSPWRPPAPPSWEANGAADEALLRREMETHRPRCSLTPRSPAALSKVSINLPHISSPDVPPKHLPPVAEAPRAVAGLEVAAARQLSSPGNSSGGFQEVAVLREEPASEASLQQSSFPGCSAACRLVAAVSLSSGSSWLQAPG